MDDAYTAIKLSPLRKVIAARMTEAKQTIPHFRLTTDIEVDALIEVRKELRELNPDTSISLNDLLVKACAAALMDVPAVNVQWVEGEIRQYRAADISVVIAVGDGLSTPIIRDANSKSIWEISREIRQLSDRATRNVLRMSEVFGGSFSVSNLGMYGIDQFDAIINPPQCAILALGRAKLRCVASHDRQVKVATMLLATLSVDHRAMDGAAAAAFMSAFARRVEQPGYLRQPCTAD